jgi:formyltetrahydrofolate deformylase
LISGHGCNILSSEQHTDRNDPSLPRFFQRVCFDISSMRTDRVTLESGINEVGSRLGMTYTITWPKVPKVCIFVSKYEHCLWELLLRYRANELPCTIDLIVSNHEDLRHIAETFGIRYEVFKITKDTKAAQEEAEIKLLHELDIDLVILARYMQIISDNFCATFPNRVINIHHSFLPAFVGSKPYHRAYERGVKLIGATAHYATADLDEGPIIEQDITRISHRDTIDDLVRKGRAIEKEVLVRAVMKHVKGELIVENNKCVVFGD